jgi:ADP-dependent NAD(P)H-hydrate dehydratase / NAD(P)H-hydrate epimerase
MIRIVTAEAAQTIDRDAMQVRGVSGIALMDAAGRAVADAALNLCREKECSHVQIFCGSGNNGGDGYVAARYLQESGVVRAEVFYFKEEKHIQGDARHHYDKMREAGVHPILVTDPRELTKRLSKKTCRIDALFGTGLNRPVEGLLREIMQMLCDTQKDQPVIAVDIPSGLHGTGGYVLGPVLKADVTVCMGFYKTGNFLYEGKSFCGRLLPVDLHYPDVSFSHALPSVALCDHGIIKSHLKPVKITGHKYSMGQVLCLGGSAAMPGAVTLAAQAALKSGAGIVRALVPKAVKPLLLQHLIEAIADEGGDNNILIESDLPHIRALCEKSGAVLLGPGLGQSPESGRLTRALVRELTLPLILDADALSALHPDDLKNCPAPRVITPHAGEFARLTGKSNEEVIHDPIGLALELACGTGTIVHLKGSTSLTALPSGDVFLHVDGAPGMATAGSGDLLAGMITSFIAQGHSAEDATLIGAWYHGKAGRAAADALGNRSMTAGDMLRFLPELLKRDEVLA